MFDVDDDFKPSYCIVSDLVLALKEYTELRLGYYPEEYLYNTNDFIDKVFSSKKKLENVDKRVINHLYEASLKAIQIELDGLSWYTEEESDFILDMVIMTRELLRIDGYNNQ